MIFRPTRLSGLALLLLAATQIAAANEVKGEEFKPFAEKHVILQLSDQANEAVVLDTANNLIKNYDGPDMIDIEIVTFGKGVRLMYADSGHEVRIAFGVDLGPGVEGAEAVGAGLAVLAGQRTAVEAGEAVVGADQHRHDREAVGVGGERERRADLDPSYLPHGARLPGAEPVDRDLPAGCVRRRV